MSQNNFHHSRNENLCKLADIHKVTDNKFRKGYGEKRSPLHC